MTKTSGISGKRLQALRRGQGLTLELLATDSGLSAGYLSQIENGQAVPSLTALQVIAAEPRRRRGAFFPDGSRRDHAGRARVRTPRVPARAPVGRGIRRARPAGEGLLVLGRLCPSPPRRPARFPFRHLGEEFALVLSGTLRLTIGERDARHRARRVGPLLLAARPRRRGRLGGAGRSALDPDPGDRMTAPAQPRRPEALELAT